jgi:hypothetical protein
MDYQEANKNMLEHIGDNMTKALSQGWWDIWNLFAF